MSLPTWERGLKFEFAEGKPIGTQVAPHMGAWIEILRTLAETRDKSVAPHMGAWIEIPSRSKSTPSAYVAPHMGAWIEIYMTMFNKGGFPGRSPHGSVD